MPIIDNRTPHLNLPLPNADNNLSNDVGRLISALNGLDSHANDVDIGKQNKTAATDALSALTPAADKIPYFTGPSAGALATLSGWIRTNLLGAADAAASRTALGLSAVATSGSTTDSLAEGSANLYHTSARVRSTVLTGLSLATNAVIVATDTVMGALGKLQAQISELPAAAKIFNTESSPTVLTGTTALTSGKTFEVNTTASAFACPTPVTPSSGDWFRVSDYLGTFGTNNFTLTYDGTNKINGLAEDYIFDTTWITGFVEYIDSTVGWRVR